MVESVVRLPKPKLVITLIASLAIMQSGFTLQKIYQLRQMSPKIQAAIEFIKKNPPDPPRIFMYPEGNYRLFPVPYEWYLENRLKQMWGGDNNSRLELLKMYEIGAVVVKKHLVSQKSSEIDTLGVYPEYFVNALDSDPRFEKLFENEGVIIFSVPK